MFIVKKKKKKTVTNRAWVPGFRVFCQLLFFICDLKEREHGAKWQIPFKKVGKIQRWFSRILVFHPTREDSEEPTSGLKMDIQASLVQTFIQISRCHFVKNQITCLRPYAILYATERTVIFSPAPLNESKKKQLPLTPIQAIFSYQRGRGMRIFSRISQKLRFQQPPKVRSICMRKITFAIQSCLHGFPYKSL